MTHLHTELALRHGELVFRGATVFRAEEDRRPRAGAGVRFSADGRSLIATTDGLLVAVEDEWMIIPAEVHRGDVSAGMTLKASGNLVVKGSVDRWAHVEAPGFVVVMGNVQNARVEAVGSVCLRSGCTSSTILAGHERQRYTLGITQLEALKSWLTRILMVLDQLSNHPSFRTLDLQGSLQPLLEILVERNFAEVPIQVAKVIKRCQPLGYLGGPLATLLAVLQRRFTGLSFVTVTRREIEQACALCGEAISQLEAEQSVEPVLWVAQQDASDDCTLVSSGRVVLEGGQYRRAKVQAASSVTVDGCLIGGSVTAGTLIEAKTAMDAPSLEVASGGEVRLGGFAQGVRIRIGTLSTLVPKTTSPVIIQQSGDRLEVRSYSGVAVDA